VSLPSLSDSFSPFKLFLTQVRFSRILSESGVVQPLSVPQIAAVCLTLVAALRLSVLSHSPCFNIRCLSVLVYRFLNALVFISLRRCKHRLSHSGLLRSRHLRRLIQIDLGVIGLPTNFFGPPQVPFQELQTTADLLPSRGFLSLLQSPVFLEVVP